MRFVEAQFSLKYEPQVRIRRSVNQIEDFLENLYGTPQTVPIPDDFAAEAPRIILNSKNGHSQISFSQISVDFTVKFDANYMNEFSLTKAYLLERIAILKELLNTIGIKQYYFCGITYNVHLNTKEKTPVDYMKDLLGDKFTKGQNIYEASQRIAVIEDDCYFVNQQIGTYKEYQGKGNSIPNLLDFKNSKLVSEGVNLVLDVNNRYEYLYSGLSKEFTSFDDIVKKIYEIIESNLSKWR